MIPIAKPWLDDQEADAARDAVLSGWVTQGPEVSEFEKEFAKFVGSEFACAVSSCTSALHVALKTLGVSQGDEVITVSHSFIATANAIRYCGAIPVFVDIDPRTFNINPCHIDAAVTMRTKAVICVHQMGMPCDLTSILEVARRYGLFVIEDAACAIGSEFERDDGWQKIGLPHGDIACFSFHPRKVITTGDGGMLTTSNSEWDAQFRLLRQHGMNVSDTVRHASRRVLSEQYECLGFNYRMTDIQAAVGRVQLSRLDKILEERRRLASRYREKLKGESTIKIPLEPDWARSNWQSYCIGLPMRCTQEVVMQFMLEQGVATRRGIMCSHREPAFGVEPWRCSCGHATDTGCSCLSESEAAQNRSILIPLYNRMTDEEQDIVIDALRKAIQI